MIKEILILLSVIISPETAIVILRKAGKHFLFTLLATEVISCLGILLTYGIFSGIFWFFGYFLQKINFIKPQERKNRTDKKIQQIRVFRALFKRELRRKINKILHGNEYFVQHLILFFLNLIPVPLFTATTVFAVKLSKLKNGIYSIAIGNFVKILIVTIFSYRYL